MSSVLTSVVSSICLPVYAAQGMWVRSRAMRLSPPSEGALSGVFGDGEPKANILTVGDSSAAGVGIPHTSGTIASQMAEKLNKRTGDPVAWRVSGHNSAVASEIRDHVVPSLDPEPYTHIVIMLGTNDIKNWHTVSRWKRDFGTLLYALRTRFPNSKIYWHQAIDLTQSPALPEPLGTIMNMRASLFNRKGAQLCVERGVVCVPPLPITEPAGYCEDGFHANALGYSIWADHMLDHFHHTPRTSPAVKEFL